MSRTPAKPVALAAAAVVLAASVWSAGGADTKRAAGDITPIDAMRILCQQRNYEKAKMLACALLWKDIHQPEALYYLAVALEGLKDREQAAAFVHILQRVLAEERFAKHPHRASMLRWCGARLRVLEAASRPRTRSRPATRSATRPTSRPAAATFTSPEKVSDAWMDRVRADLRPLHHLYCWKLVGGRKDVSKDWIHNRQGRMHRSGAKHMDKVHGRTGVLFAIPQKLSKGRSRLVIRNAGKGRVLRIGVRGYGFSFRMNVVVEKKTLFSKTIPVKPWQDVKIDLGEHAGKDVEFTIELVVPEKQRWAEGAFFDYIEFFGR